ncbi:MAG: energy transducer TonB, partial [Cytophagaceae bacterium]
MKKYKINRNKPTPGDEAIDKHKDFNKLLNDYQKVYDYKKATRPLYKDKRFLMFIISIAIVLLAIFLDGREEEEANG